MDPEQEESFRTYAWEYFRFHADQRLKTFRLFLLAAAVLAGTIAALLHAGASPWLIAAAGGLLGISSILVRLFDLHCHVCIENADAALRFLDSEQKLPNTKEGAPHVLRLFEQRSFKPKKKSFWSLCGDWCGGFRAISGIYAVFALAGLTVAGLGFFPEKLAKLAVASAAQGSGVPLPGAFPTAAVPGYGRPDGMSRPGPTLPGTFNRQFPNATPIGMPVRPFGSMQRTPPGSTSPRPTPLRPPVPGTFPPSPINTSLPQPTPMIPAVAPRLPTAPLPPGGPPSSPAPQSSPLPNAPRLTPQPPGKQ